MDGCLVAYLHSTPAENFMNIDKYKNQHVAILKCIEDLRDLVKLGIAEHAAEIAKRVIDMSSIIKLHLSTEDKMLYPALEKIDDRALNSLGKQYQHQMTHIAAAYGEFAKKWNNAGNVSQHPEDFRKDANHVLKILYERIQKENQDFYPKIESAPFIS
jgi:hemerythrin-like domain-containing protein